MRSEMISSARLLRLKLFTADDTQNRLPLSICFPPQKRRSSLSIFYPLEKTGVIKYFTGEKNLFSPNFLTPSWGAHRKFQQIVGDFRMVKKKNPPHKKSPAK